ncbi:hypothetical protein [Streptomyces sp. WMMB 322]|uniref:hypothetical protein n=1 Tax=Streptomyces sp. WMMB 322 TaxID=1286821 RepID=UPI0006E40EFB|nr:hypothetical protein [Streptomyces sp. WMMB 322]SCK28729.1 hypothetical protein H180DRAFT_02252 [Streptomyces sp. WMMB 322]
MPAEDRVRKPGTLPSAPEETGVSMSALLASCAAADAVSTPPPDATGHAMHAGHARHAEHAKPVTTDADADEGSADAAASPGPHRGRDAA